MQTMVTIIRVTMQLLLTVALLATAACSHSAPRSADLAPLPQSSPTSNISERHPSLKDHPPPPAASTPKRPQTPPPAESPAPKSVKFVSKMTRYYGHATKGKRAALTFDDGPGPHFTEMVLDELQRLHLTATFFIVGKNAAKHPEIVARIAEEGHIIASHSWDHANMAKLSEAQIQAQLDKTNELIRKLTGHEPLLFRAPYGSSSLELEKQLQKRNLQLIGWSVDTRDWEGPSAETIVQTVQQQIKPGGIILQHCASGVGTDLSNTVQALPQIVRMLQEQGYTFVTVPELLETPAYKDQPVQDASKK